MGLARNTISQSTTLDILRWKGISKPSGQVDALPSWVPDLSSSPLLAPIYPYNWPDRGNVASKDARDVALTCNERLLVAKRLKLLEGVTTAPARTKADYLERYRDMLAVLQQWYQIVREHPIYAYDLKKRINSFCGTLKITLGSRELQHME